MVMAVLTCERIRTLVLVSALLFLMGILLQAIRLFDLHPTLMVLVSGIGLISMLLSSLVVVLLTALLLIPKFNEGLKTCWH
jgi:hypothetical protein